MAYYIINCRIEWARLHYPFADDDPCDDCTGWFA